MRRFAPLALALVALMAACGGDAPQGDQSTELMPQIPLNEQEETLVQLENQVSEVSDTLQELTAMAGRLETLRAQVVALEEKLESQRSLFEEAAQRHSSRGSGARGLMLFLLGGATVLGILALRRVLFDQDTGDFPPEAHVQGVTTPPDPEQNETP